MGKFLKIEYIPSICGDWVLYVPFKERCIYIHRLVAYYILKFHLAEDITGQVKYNIVFSEKF